MSDAQKLSQTLCAISAAVAQSPINTAPSQRNAAIRLSMPRTRLAMTVASPSSIQLKKPPKTSPSPRASDAALVTSKPKASPTTFPTKSNRSPILRMAGIRTATAPSKFRPSQIPAKNSLMRYTARPTVTTSRSRPAARMSLASSPRISNVLPLRLSKMAVTPRTTREMFRPQRFRVVAIPPKFFL